MKKPNYTLAIMTGVMIAMASQAFAQDLSPVSGMLDTVVEAATGPIGRALAILAVVGAGFAMFFGRLNWPWFLAILFGAVFVFSAEAIIDGFAAG